ncbi:hypothetical protein AB0K52_20335 [Glycomyces sp. NPDC049804]|uniref:hypothetical protein n=1 Tax=Glycomyces sp. NPDC049804 TaxID=3154363 RepID=UPI003430456B
MRDFYDSGRAQPLRNALADLVEAAVGDGYGGTSGNDDYPGLTVQGVAHSGIKRWGKFARKRGLAYRAELPAAEILADPELSAFFEEMRRVQIQVHGAAGFLQAEWQGVPFTSFAAYTVDQFEVLHNFRFVCTPLSRAYPDLVFDLRLNTTLPEQRSYFHPRFGEYKKVYGPKPPSKLKQSSVLGKVPGIREARKFVDDFLSYPPNLHTDSEAYAAQVASRSYEPVVFKRDWMVRDRWLVMYEEEHIRAFGAPDETPGFLDALPRIKHLVDPPGAPGPAAV